MRQHLSPSIESLETRSLLSHSSLPSVHSAVRTDANLGTGTIASPVEVGLTTNQATYTPGQIVKMTFTETNATGQNLLVPIGPTIDGFTITNGSKTIWKSNAGIQPDFIELEKLAPGKSITLTADWTASSATGTYAADDQLDPDASATFEIVTSSAAANARRGG
jgi:hypothetical protein